MPETVIKVENISKFYRLGELHKQAGSFRDVVTSSFKRFLRKGRLSSVISQPSNTSIWALKDISFEVKQGDTVGIIGRNGAGKSTLLKILSRITNPTEGKVWIKGRVRSLLEVGMGFHPELTGRENIYLNGAILGMKKDEIDRQFDEIVAFSEIEKFLNTPVKRYSSGMYVRLAFAVAAHMDPEIMLVDEVLAVGDIAFQEKCLRKMEDDSKSGRTVLFISHNIGAVRNLCTRGIYLVEGKIQQIGNINDVCNTYIMDMHLLSKNYFERGISVNVVLKDETGGKLKQWRYLTDLIVEVNVESQKELMSPAIDLAFYKTDGVKLFAVASDRIAGGQKCRRAQKFKIEFRIRNTGLTVQEVYMDVGVRSSQEKYSRDKYIALMNYVAVIPISSSEQPQYLSEDSMFSLPVEVDTII